MATFVAIIQKNHCFVIIMLKKLMPSLNRKLLLMSVLAAMAVTAHGQQLRTSYFMEGTHYRLQLNPAMTPSRGYVNLPALGNTGASFYSNALGVNDVVDILKNSDGDDYYTSNSFMKRVKDNNQAVASVGSELIGAGWWHDDAFMSVNIGVKVNGTMQVPGSLFTFMRDMRGLNENDYSNYSRSIGHEKLDLTAYTEIGFGYARPVSDRVTLGARVKGLLGHGNIHLKVGEATVKTNLKGVPEDFSWTDGDLSELVDVEGSASIDVDADLETSFEGLDLLNNGKSYIDEVKFKASRMGVAGYGAAIDAGFSWRATNQLTISASVVDLGFICWSKGCTQVAYSNDEDMKFNTETMENIDYFAEIVGSDSPINTDILRLEIDPQGAKSRTTHLASTMTVGADYAFEGDKVRLGALYSRYNNDLKAQDEITLSVNLHPSSLVDVAFSYSPLLCGGQSAGVALKVGPVLLGTDYIYFGKNSKACNALVGISIPLGRKPID